MVYHCKNGDGYQLRQDVPHDLQEILGKKVIKRSLGTGDGDRAERLAEQYAGEYEDLFSRLRSGSGQTIDAGIISYLLYCLRDQI